MCDAQIKNKMIPGRDWPVPALSRGWPEGPGAALPGGVDPHTTGHTQSLGTIPSLPYQRFSNVCLVNLNLYIDTVRTGKHSSFLNFLKLNLFFSTIWPKSVIWITNSKRHLKLYKTKMIPCVWWLSLYISRFLPVIFR